MAANFLQTETPVMIHRNLWLSLFAVLAAVACVPQQVFAQAQSKPNILFIMGDDIGIMQPSIYHRGLMVGETPNIDKIGQEGALFTDYYAEQSCTAGRNAFFTGMHPLRTGMIPPQLPGSPSYLRPGTPALAKFLLDLGYNTGEFGKNHLGDHTYSLPTAHGFQEFWGYLYHLDAMQGVSFPDINKTPTQQTVTTLDGVNQIDYLTGRSQKSARDTFFYYSGKDPSAVRYKNWKMYFAMVSDAPQGFLTGVVPYHWTQVVNIKRDPFKTSVGQQIKTLFGMGGALASPSTAYVYDWNMLPIGQALWLRELETYINFPPLQNPASYNLEQVMQQVREMKTSRAGE
jgi:arylsulfatase A-like enzyme